MVDAGKGFLWRLWGLFGVLPVLLRQPHGLLIVVVNTICSGGGSSRAAEKSDLEGRGGTPCFQNESGMLMHSCFTTSFLHVSICRMIFTSQ